MAGPIAAFTLLETIRDLIGVVKVGRFRGSIRAATTGPGLNTCSRPGKPRCSYGALSSLGQTGILPH